MAAVRWNVNTNFFQVPTPDYTETKLQSTGVESRCRGQQIKVAPLATANKPPNIKALPTSSAAQSVVFNMKNSEQLRLFGFETWYVLG